jgi:hypothetical protein
MANFAYSFLDDAWAEEKGTAGSAACDKLGTKPLDAIMQSYVGEESKCLKPTLSMIPVIREPGNFTGFDSSKKSNYEYPIENYYTDEIKVITPVASAVINKQEQLCSTEDEHIDKKNIYSVLEPYQNDQVPFYDNKDYLQLVVFILGGILIICMMEKVLKLGSYIKR